MIRPFALTVIFAIAAITAAASPLSPQMQGFLEKHCVNCHGAQKPKGGINLVDLSKPEAVVRQAKAWEKVVRQVQDREMPPKNKPQPTAAEREEFVDALETVLANPDPKYIAKDPGRKPLHRLNHVEYENTVRDLLGVKFNAADKFPSDGAGGGGFDNNADTLFVPPLLFEKYFAAAEEIVEKAAPDQFRLKRGLFETQKSAGEKMVRQFAERAFRRPLQSSELTPFIQAYRKGLADGLPHEGAIKLAIRVMLVSPQFIFRIENDPSGTEPVRINDYELASRLSYFVWSSMPDEELFALAANNQLSNPAVLTNQLRRMLRDPKAKAFSESFVEQWLRVRDLRSSARPDPKRFPEYSDKVRDAIYREPIETFHEFVARDKNLLELLHSDYVLVNEDVAPLYGLTNVQGAEFRMVKLSDPNRGGVVTMPAILTLTSYPQRTSPVLRGRWILEEVLGTPPPPPPPLVPALPADDRPREGLTFRQRLEKHRSDPNCTSCHQKMDPLGFALENFDPIGRWRTKVGGEPVDATGELVSGEKIASPADLKQALLERKELFLRNLTERILSYALGRGLEYYDFPTVKKITEAVAKNNFSSQTLLSEIVLSYPFQFRRGEPSELSQK